MREARRFRPERAVKLDVLGRIREMIFAPDDVADFHLEVVDHIDEVKNPRAIRPADRHVRDAFRDSSGQIDPPADDVIDHDMLARRTKTDRALLFER